MRIKLYTIIELVEIHEVEVFIRVEIKKALVVVFFDAHLSVKEYHIFRSYRSDAF